MKDRIKEILTNLILYQKSTKEIKSDFGLCAQEEIVDIPDMVILKREDVSHVMQLFLDNRIDAKELSSWAELVEGRDGITYEDINTADKISMVLFWLASPEINGKLTEEKVKEYVAYLQESYADSTGKICSSSSI